MSITIHVWDLWVRFEKFVNLVLGKRVRKILQAREVAKADAFLEKYRKQGRGFVHSKPDVCTHLKGSGGHKSHSPYKDYNLAQHTFADGRTKIWCLFSCGLVAWNGDKNFDNLKKLMDQSSNRASASERFVQGYKDQTVVTFQDEVPCGRA